MNIEKIEIWENGGTYPLFNLTIWGTDGHSADIYSAGFGEIMDDLPELVDEINSYKSFSEWFEAYNKSFV